MKTAEDRKAALVVAMYFFGSLVAFMAAGPEHVFGTGWLAWVVGIPAFIVCVTGLWIMMSETFDGWK